MQTTVPAWVTYSTLIVAGVASVAGPTTSLIVGLVTRASTLKIAKEQIASALASSQRQVTAAVVSANRQKWIDALRDDLAEFVSTRQVLEKRRNEDNRDEQLVRDLTRKILLLFHRIELRLNPNEEDHSILISMLSHFSGKPSSGSVAPTIEDVVALSQKILKREWERVKRAE